MSFLHPLQVVAAVLTEWVRHEQEKVIEFLQTETEVLLEQLGDKRILLSDDDRRLLAVKGMALEKEDLESACVIVQPDTLRRWHRDLVEGNRYQSKKRKTGRPSTGQEIIDLVLLMARENPSWGYRRIEGALSNVGYSISSSTVANILKHHGIEPAPQRQHRLSWKTFIKAHMDVFEEVNLLSIFGMFAGLFSWRVMFRDRIRDASSESDVPIEEMPPVSTADVAIDSFPELEDIEENDVSRSTTSIKSLQWTRGPPTPFEVFKSTPSHPFAKAA
jgi:transposase